MSGKKGRKGGAKGKKPKKGKRKGQSKKHADAEAPKKVENVSILLKSKGNEFFKRQEYEKAIDNYTKCLMEIDKCKNGDVPDRSSVLSNRSAAFIGMKDFSKALEDAEECTRLKPEWAKGYYRKGIALEALLKYDHAIAAFEDGLNAAPDDKTIKQSCDNLKQMIEEMKITTAQMNTVENPEKDKFNIMIDWLLKGGARFPKLYLQYYSEDFRGVHALTKIPTDEVILYVPHDYIMTSDVAKESDVGKKIIASGVELRSKHSYLAAYLLQEKHNPNSFWKPYVDILPKDYKNMPIFFGDDELKYLKGSFSLDKIADRIDSLKTEYENLCRHVHEFSRFTHEEFVWARLVVITRIFGLVIKGTKTDGLVPMADMLNHKRPRETKWTFSDAENGFIITTLKGMSSGDEVYDSYGRKCNSRFFVNYGFSLDENEDNEVVLDLRIPKSDPHYGMKVRFLGGNPNSVHREYQIPMSYKEKKTKECFSFLRFAHARDSEMMLLHSADGLKLEEIEPLSIENEKKALQSLAQSARNVLGGFDTTLEEDLRMLREDVYPMFSNIRNAIVMRRGEKQVLHYYLDLAKRCCHLLDLPWKDLKREAAKCYNSEKAADVYITNVVVPLVRKTR